MLNSGMMYVPDNSLTRFDLAGFKNKHSILDKARQYEFKEKNYQMALKYYQTVLPDAHKEQSRGEILNAIARVQKKLDLNDKAIETYDLIYDKYSLVFIQNRIPLGTVALLEKSSLYIKKSDSISALENIQLLLNQIQKKIHLAFLMLPQILCFLPYLQIFLLVCLFRHTTTLLFGLIAFVVFLPGFSHNDDRRRLFRLAHGLRGSSRGPLRATVVGVRLSDARRRLAGSSGRGARDIPEAVPGRS